MEKQKMYYLLFSWEAYIYFYPFPLHEKAKL